MGEIINWNKAREARGIVVEDPVVDGVLTWLVEHGLAVYEGNTQFRISAAGAQATEVLLILGKAAALSLDFPYDTETEILDLLRHLQASLGEPRLLLPPSD